MGYFGENAEFSNEASVYLKEVVIAFQKQNGVTADGILDEDLLELLFSDNAAGKDGKSKQRVNAVTEVPEGTERAANNIISKSRTTQNTEKDKTSGAVIGIIFLLVMWGFVIIISMTKRLVRGKKEELSEQPVNNMESKDRNQTTHEEKYDKIERKIKSLKEERLQQGQKATDERRYNEAIQRKLIREQRIVQQEEMKAQEAEEYRQVAFYSQRCKQLNEMITKYKFETGLRTNFRLSYVFHSRMIFDETEPHDALAFLARDDATLKYVFDKVKSNRQKLERFMHENEIIKQSSDMTISNSGVPKERFIQIEKELCRRLQSRVPVDLVINLDLYYRSVGGNKHASRLYELNFEDLEKAYSIQQIPEIEYTCTQEEREKMTLSLRYDILRRDGFRCVLCGATADDGVKLHVDHIIPVSKGGKTVPSNLRTLCDRCNFGKRDKYIPNGLN